MDTAEIIALTASVIWLTVAVIWLEYKCIQMSYKLGKYEQEMESNGINQERERFHDEIKSAHNAIERIIEGDVLVTEAWRNRIAERKKFDESIRKSFRNL
jgi:hypothetical protein